MNLGAIHDDVVFDHAGAAELMRELRLTADMLDEHRNERPAHAAQALAEWRGVYAEQFTSGEQTAAGTALALAAALRLAANGLGELSDAAKREQSRREDARVWEKEQNDRNLLQKGWDNARDYAMGEDDIPPPPPPEDPMRYVSEATAVGAR